MSQIAFARMQRPVAQSHESEHRHRRRIVGRDCEHLLEACDRSPCRFRIQPVCMMHAAHKQIESAEIFRAHAHRCLRARFFKPAHKRRDDPLYEFVLNLERIVRAAMVALSPEHSSRGAFNERRLKAQSRSGQSDGASHNESHAQRRRDMLRILEGVIAEAGRSAENRQRAETGERGDQVVGQPLAPMPIFLTRLKWQDGETDASARLGSWSGSPSRIRATFTGSRMPFRVCAPIPSMRKSWPGSRASSTLSERQTPPG